MGNNDSKHSHDTATRPRAWRARHNRLERGGIHTSLLLTLVMMNAQGNRNAVRWPAGRNGRGGERAIANHRAPPA